MISFAHAAAAPEATRRYDLGIPTEMGGPSVVLTVRYAGESNKPLLNATLKRLNVVQSRAKAAGEKFTAEQMTANRADTVELFAAHVIAGWEHVTDEGKPIPFSAEAALRLLNALIDPVTGRPDIWIELQSFCNTAANFAAAVVDAVELGKK